MMQTELTAEAIYKQEFKTALRGYSQEEVDQFLDVVIRDYEKMTKEIERLRQENESLRRGSNEQTEPLKPAQPVASNYDMLRRISNLEKAVFGKQVGPSE
ncbi:cell division regulator GpsB [Exiguobacterium sp. SL-10]|uniref:cell division regulator GpsB n=1 Tax=unclassified Exiguobacterium TaxID=2644629 RepID=UPI00103CCA32|nr:MULTISPECIES: cell division regulator GpsB [unclassified Exiguobacterium]TCI23097.1 cell division regulator GpsB [Exiguobacterium sp. SL-9]TCI31961.1 cell division regulator GpsB [Exiguobacterium sp. SL-10]